MKKIIIDTDPGIDDFMALAAALNSDEIEVLGVTTSYGNAELEHSTNNALKIVSLFEKNIDVYPGSHGPFQEIEKSENGIKFHGLDGLGEIQLRSSKKPEKDKAWDFITKQVSNFPKEITLVTLGPLTNLARTLHSYSLLKDQIKEVVIMGGAVFQGGNATHAAEYNILSDPFSANVVFSSGLNITLIGLDVTEKIHLDLEFFEKIKEGKKAFSAHLYQSYLKYLDSYKRYVGVEYTHCHDPSTILYLHRPEIFTYAFGRIKVVTEGAATGQTLFLPESQDCALGDWDNQTKVKVAVEVDESKAKALIASLLS